MEANNSNKTEKEPISFYQLFNQDLTKINQIEIPIIQRDYAQGRMSAEVSRIRKQFIDVLFNALQEDSAPIQLDFVYGSVKNKKLIPLDGQQRLTTLFLLHWYVSRNEHIDETRASFLKTFSYHTRFSSERFCTFLIEMFQFELNDIVSLSDYIKDQYSFIRSWQNDPTVSSMLIMLDTIHGKFKNTTNLWYRLVDSDKPAITFYFLSLEELQMTDKLYVKMNSRGKPLTEFEHFKSFFQAAVKKECGDNKLELIATKFDGIWTDLFWNYRGDNDIIDEEFIRYFHFISEVLSWKQNIGILQNTDFFEITEKVYKNTENIDFLEKSLDVWCGIDIDMLFNNIFTTVDDQIPKVRIFTNATNYFNQCCQYYGEYSGKNRTFSLSDTLMLYSVLIYLLNKQNINAADFLTRIRIVRNLVWNSQFEIRNDTMGDMLKDIDNIIIHGLIQIDDKSFNKLQKEEEKKKIAWRTLFVDSIDDLNHLEDHPLLRGATSIINYIDEPNHLSKRVSAFYNAFMPTGKLSFSTLRQVMLALGDYGQLFSWRYAFGGNNEGTWRDILVPSQQRVFFDKTQNIVQIFLDRLDLNKTIEEQCRDIVNDYLNTANKDWRYYIVKYDSMRYGGQGMYYWRDSINTKDKRGKFYEMYMMNTYSSLSGKHWDPFLYTLYHTQPILHCFELEDYGEDLFIPQLNCYLRCKQSIWEFLDTEKNIFHQYDIPQDENDIDLEDRIELIRTFISNTIKNGFIV